MMRVLLDVRKRIKPVPFLREGEQNKSAMPGKVGHDGIRGNAPACSVELGVKKIRESRLWK